MQRAARSAPRTDYIPHNTRRRVKYTILYEHGMIDISRWPQSWMWSVQSSPVRHLLKDPQDDMTLCGHRWAPGDTIEDNPIDGASAKCIDCTIGVSKS